MINLWTISWLVADEVAEWCFRKLNYQSSNSNQSRVYVFEVSSFHLVRVLLFSHKLMSSSLWSHELWHATLLLSLSPRVCSNSCPLSRWGSSFYKNNLRMYVGHCYLFFLSRSQSYSLTYCLKYSLLFVQLPLLFPFLLLLKWITAWGCL